MVRAVIMLIGGKGHPGCNGRIQVQWSSGWGPKPPPRTLGPTTFYLIVFSRRGKVVAKIESKVRAPRPAPALTRVQRPLPHARSTPQARTPPSAHFARPRLALSAPLPSPRPAAPHVPSAPPALRARALGPHARWRLHRQLPQR